MDAFLFIEYCCVVCAVNVGGTKVVKIRSLAKFVISISHVIPAIYSLSFSLLPFITFPIFTQKTPQLVSKEASSESLESIMK